MTADSGRAYREFGRSCYRGIGLCLGEEQKCGGWSNVLCMVALVGEKMMPMLDEGMRGWMIAMMREMMVQAMSEGMVGLMEEEMLR